MALFKTALGYAVRTERMRQGLNLRDVAGRAYMALGYLSEIERGMKDPSSEVIEMIAKALGMTTSQLIWDTHELLADWDYQEKEMDEWDLALTKTSTN